MHELGYVIREDHIRAAIQQAGGEELPQLEQLLVLIRELDHLELTLQERVTKARSSDGADKTELSVSAMDEMSQSEQAAREIDKLLTRRCNRADSAVAVVKEILAEARSDMKEANRLDNQVPEDDPAEPIISGLYQKKRKLVESMREFVVGFGS